MKFKCKHCHTKYGKKKDKIKKEEGNQCPICIVWVGVIDSNE